MVAMAAMMVVRVMTVLIARHEEIVIGMPRPMEIMIVGMGGHRRGCASRVPMQAHHRRPGILERDDEHENEGDQATHAGHCRGHIFLKATASWLH